MRQWIIGILLTVCSALFAGSPVVENVRFSQRTDGSLLVDIYYDVTDEDGDLLEITIEASDDHGATWVLPCASLTGDAGEGVTPGVDKHAVWDFHADNPGVSGDGYRVRVIAREITTMTGNDGRIYRTVRIGDQWWMAENLRETKYRNGDDIPEEADDTAWTELSTGARCSYNNDENKADTYGYLYNWHAVDDSRNIAPEGWRVSTDADWRELFNYLIENGYNWDGTTTGNEVGKSLASAGGEWVTWGTAGAVGNNQFTNNSSGFSALPAGYRSSNSTFYHLAFYAYFWSATENDTNYAWSWYLYYNYSGMFRNHLNKRYGFSVRLIQGGDIVTHTASTPETPSGPDTGTTGEDLTFTTGGSTCSQGHDIVYRFDWGDETISDWGDATRNISYSDTGTYEIRAQARCAEDTTIVSDWSDARTVTINPAFETSTIKGNDGRVYRTVKIGDQWWMAENLRETRYRNGNLISHVIGGPTWNGLSTGARCAYHNNETLADTYGYLYNWYAVTDGRKIAPAGWRVPTDEDWKRLERSLGMTPPQADATGSRGTDIHAGGKLKTTGTIEDGTGLWNAPNTAATNESGFTAQPGGFLFSVGGWFDYLGKSAAFWTGTENGSDLAWYRGLFWEHSGINRSNPSKRDGCSVRLVRD